MIKYNCIIRDSERHQYQIISFQDEQQAMTWISLVKPIVDEMRTKQKDFFKNLVFDEISNDDDYEKYDDEVFIPLFQKLKCFLPDNDIMIYDLFVMNPTYARVEKVEMSVIMK